MCVHALQFQYLQQYLYVSNREFFFVVKSEIHNVMVMIGRSYAVIQLQKAT